MIGSDETLPFSLSAELSSSASLSCTLTLLMINVRLIHGKQIITQVYRQSAAQ